jgi:hypothetical protein
MATATATTEKSIWIYTPDEIYSKLIMPGHATKEPRKFLEWLATSDDYYVEKLISSDVRQGAKTLSVFECTYANADVDWRISVSSFIYEYVPVRIWFSYRNFVASGAES